MRVNGDGQTSDTVVKEGTGTDQVVHGLDTSSLTYSRGETQTGPSYVKVSEHIITNADQQAGDADLLRELDLADSKLYPGRCLSGSAGESPGHTASEHQHTTEVNSRNR